MSGKGLPPMKVRAADEINSYLGNKAIVDGYSQIPIYTYSSATTDDDLNYGGCQYLLDTDNYLYSHNETFAGPAEFILPVIRMPVAEAFGVSEEDAWNLSYTQI
jgi:hypothetical protein